MPYGTTAAVFMQGIIPAELTGAVAKPFGDTTPSVAEQAHASANMDRKTPERIVFFDIYSLTAA
jgi:hypothetical protein